MIDKQTSQSNPDKLDLVVQAARSGFQLSATSAQGLETTYFFNHALTLYRPGPCILACHCFYAYGARVNAACLAFCSAEALRGPRTAD